MIDETSIAGGITLSRWFGNEARRVYAVMSESDGDREHRQLIELIERKGGEITARQLMQAARKFRNSADDATAALQELVDSDLGEWVTSKPGSKGGQPQKAFRLTVGTADSGDGDNTPAGRVANGGTVTVTTVAAPATNDWGIV